MTYGWAIMVFLVAIVALYYFGILSMDKFVPDRCVIEAGIGCIDHRIKDTFVELVFMNSKGEDITVSGIDVGGCTGSASGMLRNGEQKTFKVTGCSLTSSDKHVGEFSVTYTSSSGLEHKALGKVSGKVDQSNLIVKTLQFREDGTFVGTTNDAQIQEDIPNWNLGSGTSLTVDGFSPSAHAVLQFSNIIGSGVGQIPENTQIDSATLTVNCISTAVNAPNVYLLLEDWVESEVTWNSRKSGVSWGNTGADGLISHDSTAVQWDCQWPLGYKDFDMASFVQSWADGTANYGVVLIDTGDDGLDFDTSENANPANRPLLTVVYTVYE